jgi:cold shock CspA family protein
MKYTGVITTSFAARKFGFIKSEGRDIFLHAVNLQEGVPVLGQKVEFELGEAATLGKPKQAVNIAFVDEAFEVLSASTNTSAEVAK